MSAIDHLMASHTLRFERISFHLHTPLSDSDSNTMPFCVHKAPGSLNFTLTGHDLGLLLPGDLAFPFTPVRVDGNNITWAVDQPLDIPVSIGRITRAQGQIVTRVDDVTVSRGIDCDGAQCVVAAAITTIGDSNSITISIDTPFGTATAIVSNIMTTGATACETLTPAFFEVAIHANQTPHDGCGHYYQLQGSTVRFTASVTNLHVVGNVTSTTFHWDPPPDGMVPINGLEDATLEVRLDGHGPVGLTVHVTVTTDIDGGIPHSTVVRFAVLTADEAALQSMLCIMDSQVLLKPPMAITGIGAGFTIGDLRFIDPLWDPNPDIMRNGAAVLLRGYSLHELNQLQAAADHIANMASAITKQTSQIIEQYEAQNTITPSK